MRVALLSYRSKPHCGGQGVYVRHLSRELTALGHQVEVFSGQPYPALDPGVRLTRVPSLDLYREPDPFRTPRLTELRDLVDVRELLTMWTAGFPEPRMFSHRVARLLARRRGDFDVVHDNQTLGYGMLDIARAGLPLVTTIHHPITLDRRVDLAAATNPLRRLAVRRWYGFLRMQRSVARRQRIVLTVSESAARDIVADFGVDPARIQVVPLGVDGVFSPPTEPRVPGRIVAVASADSPMKGVGVLIEAFAKLRTERDLELVLVARPRPGGQVERLLDRLAVRDSVRFVHGLADSELAALLGSAEVACVPSLYEGFSLPAVEAMACATPLVASRAGAIPEVVGAEVVGAEVVGAEVVGAEVVGAEVVGAEGACADLVTPGDVEELSGALARLLDDPARRARLGAAGRRRAEERFGWRAVAEATAAAYQRAVDARADRC